ncbi:MAG: hypothetical protein KI791_17920 [Cyclobacteriaceae bacterium]|nr:hypothetical protein [Cyclobacteriaceae bacterium SS2]
MALKTFVKINQVSSLSDARYCAGMGVDVLGFSLVAGNPSYVDPQQFKEITQWVSGPKFAGEFDSASVDQIKLASVDYSLDFIEISSPDYLETVAELNIPIILKSTVSSESDLEKLSEIVSFGGDFLQYLHLEIDHSKLDEFNNGLSQLNTPLVLHTNDPAANLDQLLKHGISLTAKQEEQTGLQDYGEIMDVLEALETED